MLSYKCYYDCLGRVCFDIPCIRFLRIIGRAREASDSFPPLLINKIEVKAYHIHTQSLNFSIFLKRHILLGLFGWLYSCRISKGESDILPKMINQFL